MSYSPSYTKHVSSVSIIRIMIIQDLRIPYFVSESWAFSCIYLFIY